MIRRVEAGELTAAGYGLLSSANVDPIEKKPLYHFRPGSAIFSIGGWGCNFACVFCQNWTISQQLVEESTRYSPEDIVSRAASMGSEGIAYTYNEPLVNMEFVSDCCRLAKAEGLSNVLVTNGYVNPGPAADLLPLTDALNIDVKSMDDAFYREHCRGSLQPVKDFARQASDAGCHVEITNLIIPGLNDDPGTVASLAEWVATALGPSVPLHLSAYRPQHKMSVPATPPKTLKAAYHACAGTLHYVYLGNVRTDKGQDTACPECGATLVARNGYATRVIGVTDRKCSECGREVDIVF